MKRQQNLATSEPDTYAGLWIQHSPKFGVIVNTTGDAAKVSKYARGTALAQLTEIRQAAKSLRQLEADQKQADRVVRSLGMRSESGINVFKNQVELYVLDEEQLVAEVEDTLTFGTQSSLSLPAGIEIIEVPSFTYDFVDALQEIRSAAVQLVMLLWTDMGLEVSQLLGTAVPTLLTINLPNPMVQHL